MKKQKFSIQNRIKSFKYAFRGIYDLLSSEHNAHIHSIFAILAILLGFILKISSTEWMILILTIALIFALEAINTSIESLADFVSPQKNNLIKKTKDLAAASVLIMAIAALFIGAILFIPKLLILLDI